VRISTFNGAVDGVQTINITPVNDPIALQDPGSITRLRDMSDSSTATGTLVAYDPDIATVIPVSAVFSIVGGTDDTLTATNSLVGTFGNLSVETATGNYSYVFTAGPQSSDSFETFTVTAFDGVDTATGLLRIRLLQTLPAGSSTPRTISFTSPSPLAFSKIYGETFSLAASPSAGSNDGTITYSVGSSTACSVTGSVVTITAGTGTCSVTATISAGTTFAAATTTTPVTVTVSKRQITINGLSQEMTFDQSSPNLGAYELIGSLAGSDAISVSGVRQQSILTGNTPVAISVTFTSGSALNYEITINSGSLVVIPGRVTPPSFGEVTREVGGFSVVLRNYNPSLTNVLTVSEGTATIVGPIDGVYRVVVRGISGETTLGISSTRVGYSVESASTKGGPLYQQTVTMDLSSLSPTQIGLSRNLKELSSVNPFVNGLSYSSLTPEICTIKLEVLVEILAEGTCSIRATANPSEITIPGAAASSSFVTFRKSPTPSASPTPTPSASPTPTPSASPTPTPSASPTSKPKAPTQPKTNSLVIPFDFAKFTLTNSDREKLKQLRLPKGATVKITGYAQRNNSQPDLGLSLDRAIEVKKAILEMNPSAKVSVVGRGNRPFAPCAAYRNKCAVISIRS
jgi:outer membrane protein OmpA-like peptidoglycan-associated protein